MGKNKTRAKVKGAFSSAHLFCAVKGTSISELNKELKQQTEWRVEAIALGSQDPN